MKNNIIITGCGRSGTSMVAGSIVSAGQYNIGGTGHKPDRWNEKGYFETNKVNTINNDILNDSPDLKSTEGLWQGWLSVLSSDKKIKPDPCIKDRILNIVLDKPFCLKDPRFSYTLPVWLPYLPQDTKFICVFRYPASVIKSILTHCTEAEYLKGIMISKEFCEQIYYSMYDYILANYGELKWLFIHYNQMMYSTEQGISRVEKFIDSKINHAFGSQKLCNFYQQKMELSSKVIAIYNELCYMSDCPVELR